MYNYVSLLSMQVGNHDDPGDRETKILNPGNKVEQSLQQATQFAYQQFEVICQIKGVQSANQGV